MQQWWRQQSTRNCFLLLHCIVYFLLNSTIQMKFKMPIHTHASQLHSLHASKLISKESKRVSWVCSSCSFCYLCLCLCPFCCYCYRCILYCLHLHFRWRGNNHARINKQSLLLYFYVTRSKRCDAMQCDAMENKLEESMKSDEIITKKWTTMLSAFLKKKMK